MKITEAQVRNVADLANLKLTDQEIARWNTRGIGICTRFLDHAASLRVASAVG